MAVRKPIPGQIENRNFLVPTGFQFQVNRAPKVSYFGQMVNIPSLDFNVATQLNYLREIPLPGTMIDFQDLTLRFLVDENLENYMEIQKWIRGLGFPESIAEFNKFESGGVLPTRVTNERGDDIYSDGTLQILSSNLIPKFNVNFKDLFPVSLTTLTFDATDTDIQYFTADAEFKYTIYNITDLNGNAI